MVETSIKGRGLHLLVNSYHYRPQTKFAKVMFLHLSVILITGGGGCLPQCMLGSIPQDKRQTSPDQRQTPLGPEADPPGPEADTLPWTRGRHTPPWTRGRHPYPQDQRQTPHPEKTHPPSATSGRYVSYWNAYLLQPFNALKNKKPIFQHFELTVSNLYLKIPCVEKSSAGNMNFVIIKWG